MRVWWTWIAVFLVALPIDRGQAQTAVRLPTVALPTSEPTGPSLWVTPAEVAMLVARRTDPGWAPLYASIRGGLDGRLGDLSTIDDDTRCRLAKSAALLQLLGESPPVPWTSYLDVAVQLVRGLQSRRSAALWEASSLPAGVFDPLRDAPRLQSLAEAYDLLRGSFVDPADDASWRNTVAGWADALRGDALIGSTVRQNNWAIRSGGALVTVALAMPGHPHAADWLTFGHRIAADAWARMQSPAGWYREGPHYLNYSLGTLFPAAWHVRRTTASDWWPALRPAVQGALAVRQPTGGASPFEEGLTTRFPFDVFSTVYPDLGMQLSWLSENPAGGSATAFENQANHEVTRFLVGAASPSAPVGSATMFLGGDSHLHALRSDWGAEARQLTMISAVDFAAGAPNIPGLGTLDVARTRHNTQNPMDLSLSAWGQELLVTSSGGPLITRTPGPSRDRYLDVRSRNTPLVLGMAPYVTDPSRIVTDARLDSWGDLDRDGASDHDLLDVVRTEVSGYTPSARVRRMAALIGGTYMVLVDEARGTGAPFGFQLPLRGRGVRTPGTTAGSSVDGKWTFRGVDLQWTAVSARALRVDPRAGLYAEQFGQSPEEAIDGIEIRVGDDVPTTNAQVLTLLYPRRAADAVPRVVTAVDGIGIQITVEHDGVEDTITAGRSDISADVGVIRSMAALTLVRRVGGRVTGLAVVDGRRLSVDGTPWVISTDPVTFSATIDPRGILVTVSPDQTSPTDFRIRHPAEWAAQTLSAIRDGRRLGAGAFRDTGTWLEWTGLVGPVADRIAPNNPPSLDLLTEVEAREGEPLELRPAGSDPDGDILTWTVTADPPLPNDIGFDPVSGALRWTPGYELADRAGPRPVLVRWTASDGAQDVSVTQTVRVQNTNRPPTLTAPGQSSGRPGLLLTIPLDLSDPDGDALSARAVGDPSVEQAPVVDVARRVAIWDLPSDLAPGAYRWTWLVSDGIAEVSSVTRVEVGGASTDRPPRFVSIDGEIIDPEQPVVWTVSPGESMTRQLRAVDPEGEAVTYSLSSGPPEVSVQASGGRVDWEVPRSTGGYVLVFAAADPEGASTTLAVEVQVRGEAPPPAGCGCSASSIPTMTGVLGLLAGMQRRRRRRST